MISLPKTAANLSAVSLLQLLPFFTVEIVILLSPVSSASLFEFKSRRAISAAIFTRSTRILRYLLAFCYEYIISLKIEYVNKMFAFLNTA